MRRPNRRLWKPGMMQVQLFVRTEDGATVELVMDDVRGRDKRHVVGLITHADEAAISNVVEEAEARNPPPKELDLVGEWNAKRARAQASTALDRALAKLESH